jgi:anti-sigma B factor antagonist
MTDLANVDVHEPDHGIVVARIAGDLDLSNLHAVQAALTDALPNDALGLVVDLTPVNFIDSSGVETLFRLQRGLSIRRQRFAVALPPEARTRRALELGRAGGELVLRPTVAEAVEALRTQPSGEEPAA